MTDKETSQFLQDWEAHEKALIACAQRAWASLSKGYNLIDFYIQDSFAIVGVGYPPRAQYEYHHAFLFERHDWEGQTCEHLRTIGKAPGHTTLRWWGTRLTSRRALVATFERGEFFTPKAYADTF